jgi:hypothetical protein
LKGRNRVPVLFQIKADRRVPGESRGRGKYCAADGRIGTQYLPLPLNM